MITICHAWVTCNISLTTSAHETMIWATGACCQVWRCRIGSNKLISEGSPLFNNVVASKFVSTKGSGSFSMRVKLSGMVAGGWVKRWSKSGCRQTVLHMSHPFCLAILLALRLALWLLHALLICTCYIWAFHEELWFSICRLVFLSPNK